MKSIPVPKSGMEIKVVEVDTSEAVPAQASVASSMTLLPELAPPPTDMVGPGDILDISIYEAGVTLFSGGGIVDPTQVAANPGAQAQKLPPIRVDDNGDIDIPYAGKLHVAGRTIGDVETMVQQSLRKLSQNPQVIISLDQAITNSVIVGGEVAKPGRLVLQTNRETLTDAIALAGGYRGSANDLTLRIVRGNANVDVRMSELANDPKLDVRAYPGDRLMLINDPRTYSVMGAPGRVQQIPFGRSSVSLAEAIADAGGANSNLGNPAAVFLFRYVKDDQGKQVPVVYHVNMKKAGSYFLTQHFAMRDRDIVYFGVASSNQVSRLIQLISQLFSPAVSLTYAADTVTR